MEGPLEVGGVSCWLEVEDRAEALGLAGGNQLEEGRVMRVLLGTLLYADDAQGTCRLGSWQRVGTTGFSLWEMWHCSTPFWDGHSGGATFTAREAL